MTTRSKSRKAVKDGPVFEKSAVRAVGARLGKTRDIYRFDVKTENVSYDDMYKYVNNVKERFATKYPNAKLNVSVKYSSHSTPISAGFFDVTGDTKLKAPYDYHNDDDEITGFTISFVE